MRKITILIDPTVDSAQVQKLMEQLAEAGVESLTYHENITAFNGSFAGDMESLKSIRYVEEAAPTRMFPSPAPSIFFR